MACFADINVSQGSVATHARCGGRFPFNCKFTQESSSEKNCKSVKIWQNYGHESVAPFFVHPAYTRRVRYFTTCRWTDRTMAGLGAESRAPTLLRNRGCRTLYLWPRCFSVPFPSKFQQRRRFVVGPINLDPGARSGGTLTAEPLWPVPGSDLVPPRR